MLYSRLADIPDIVDLVVFPQNHDEVVKIVKLSNKYQIPLSIVAGGSSVTLGIQPPSRAVAVNLCKMNKVLTVHVNQSSRKGLTLLLDGMYIIYF